MSTPSDDQTSDPASPAVAGTPGKRGRGAAAGPRQYACESVTVTWDAGRCIHAARCIAHQPAVFDADRRPWIDVSQAAPGDVAAAVRACPTGALHYSPEGASAAVTLEAEAPPATAVVEVQVDGPYYVRGDVTLCGTDGAVLVEGESRLALCRCGATGNAPYCDNSHLATKFANDPRSEEDTSGSSGGPQIRIEPDEPGPYHVSGGVKVMHPDGSVLAETDEVWLCRCGRSGSKPFCDGSHNRS